MQGEAIFERLLALHPKIIDLSLDRILGLLAKLGNPHQHLPPVIHIAGTNGKGSTTAFCRAMLEAAGLRVHVYTSPHLVRFNERIRLAGIGIVSDAQLLAALEECEQANGGAPITFFEITTAAAFLLFSRVAADFVILEVGLGGRLDATNVIERPVLSVITPVSMDHEGYLGNSLALIAREKAGIIKRQVPCVVAQQEPDAESVIEGVARRHHAPLFACNEHWSVQEERGRLVYQDEDGLLDLPMPRLFGRHQLLNAGTAIACLRQLNQRRAVPLVDIKAMETGLMQVEWPARLQRLKANALGVRGAGEIWLDGGHNPGAAIALASTMGELEERAPRPLILVVGMLTTKDAAHFFAPFAGLARRVFTLTIPNEANAMSAENLAGFAQKAGLAAQATVHLDEALNLAASCGQQPRILICGSLYLAGYVLKQLEA